MKKIGTRPISVFLALFGTFFFLSVLSPVFGQYKPQVAAPIQDKDLKIQGLRTAPVKVNEELLRHLTAKKQFNNEILRTAISYRGELPILRLKSGKNVAVEPIRVERMPTAREREVSLIINPQVKAYLSHFNRKWIGDIIIIPTGPPDNVNRVNCQTVIRDQGDRGTCTAFAAMAGYEAFAKCRKNTVLDLSEQHTYHTFMQQVPSTCKADPGIKTWEGAGFLTNHRVCAEVAMPYTATYSSLPTNDAAHVPAGCSNTALYGFVTTQTIFGTAFGGGATVNANNTNYLESILASGNEIVYGLYCAGTDWHDGSAETGVIDVQMSGGNPAPAWGGHAMLLVGYNRPGKYFIFKNSWGPGHGHAGYFYLSYNYLQTYGKYGYFITGITP
jgi:hypothetical protein